MANELVIGANNTLVTDGTFDVVVAGLRDLVNNGERMGADEVEAVVLGINVGRCARVLPAIDIYLGTASQLLGSGITLVANRPNNCPTTS